MGEWAAKKKGKRGKDWNDMKWWREGLTIQPIPVKRVPVCARVDAVACGVWNGR